MADHFRNVKQNLSRNLRARRAFIGLTQEELASRSGIDRTFLSRIERGIANPSLEVMYNLATTLGISLEDLLRAYE